MLRGCREVFGMKRRKPSCEVFAGFPMLALMFLASPTAASVPELSVVDCANATHTCTSRTEKCFLLHHTFKIDCNRELRGKTPQGLCLDRCRSALIGLSSIVEGYKLITCECDDLNCAIDKERLSECWNDKINFTEHDFNFHSAREQTCKAIRSRCKENELCHRAYSYYGYACRDAIETSAMPCSEQCAASARILYAVSNGYFTCDCRGDWWCNRENQLIGAKCFGNSALEPRSTVALTLFLAFLALRTR